jgi:hypothetical protein
VAEVASSRQRQDRGSGEAVADGAVAEGEVDEVDEVASVEPEDGWQREAVGSWATGERR